MNLRSRCTRLLFRLSLAWPCLVLGVEPLDLPEGTKPNPAKPEWDERLSANRQYFKALDEVRADYRGRLAESLRHANRVELFLLDYELVKDVESLAPDQRFDVFPYKASARILKVVKAAPDVAQTAKQHFKRLLKTRDALGGGAFCHYPVHGVRFFKDDDLLFQTSLCWICENYFVAYPDDHETATWVGINDDQLKSFMNEQVPVPKEIIEKFKAAFPVGR